MIPHQVDPDGEQLCLVFTVSAFGGPPHLLLSPFQAPDLFSSHSSQSVSVSCSVVSDSL